MHFISVKMSTRALKYLNNCYITLLFDTTRKSSHSIQICGSRILSSWSFKPFYYRSSNIKFVSSILNYAFHNLNFSYTTTSSEIQKLSDFITSVNEDFEEEQIEDLDKLLTFLLSKGCTSADIKQKCIPYLKSNLFSYSKFNQLDHIYSDILLLLPLLSLPLQTIKLAAKQARNDKYLKSAFPNRIDYLSYYLELKPSEVILAVSKHSALLTMKFERLDFKMKILKSANISSKYIVQDLWIFNYNERLLASRIQAAVKAGMELKPWMLRCSEKFFESMLMKFVETQRILNGKDVSSYLAKKLNCSAEYVEYMMERNKSLKSINIPKLEQILNFLFEKGYTPQEVRLFPRVFCSSVHTLSRRFVEYQHIKSTLPSIPQLCISAKKFEISLSKK